MRHVKYEQTFLTKVQADYLFDQMMGEPWIKSSASSYHIFYGPQLEGMGRSFPEFLLRLRSRIEDFTEHIFNSVQGHRYERGISVKPHRDPHGCIGMVTLGIEHPFRFGGRSSGKYPNITHTDFEEQVLHHGSLVLFYGRVAHSMTPITADGSRITLVHRYITEHLQQRDSDVNPARKAAHVLAYEEAQAKWKMEKRKKELTTDNEHSTKGSGPQAQRAVHDARDGYLAKIRP